MDTKAVLAGSGDAERNDDFSSDVSTGTVLADVGVP